MINTLDAYFSNLSENFASKLSNPSNKYGVLSVAQYYSHSGLSKELFYNQQEKNIHILTDIDTKKAPSIYRLPRRSLKDGVDVLAKLVTDNLSKSLTKFPSALKLAKGTPVFKIGRNIYASNHRPIFLLSLLIEKVVYELATKFFI